MRIPLIILIYAFAIFLIISFGTIGTYIFSLNNGFNVNTTIISSLYFTIVTLSTVGYGGIVPITRSARIFVMVLIIIGLTLFLTTITTISSEIMSSKIKKISGEISYLETKFLKSEIVLIGIDFTNIALAQLLEKQNKKFFLLTSDNAAAERLRKQKIKTFVADETSKQDLSKFNLKNTKLIVIDFRDNSKIIYTILVIKSIAPKTKIVVIAPNAEIEFHLINLNMNIEIINPAALTAIQINKLL